MCLFYKAPHSVITKKKDGLLIPASANFSLSLSIHSSFLSGMNLFPCRPCTLRNSFRNNYDCSKSNPICLSMCTKQGNKMLYSMSRENKDMYLVGKHFHLQISSMTPKA